jgi:hypothetical protein
MKATRRFLPAAALAIALLASSSGFFPEASFTLAPESRLPRWFALPAGVTRSQLKVTMDYYVGMSGRRTATVTLLGPNGNVLAKARGSLKGSEPLLLKTRSDASAPGYPTYEVITANGVADIVEHRRMEPIFYITDDANVWTELGVTR